MYKIIGCLLIMTACTGYGYGKNKELQCHITNLVSLKKLFHMIHRELKYTHGTFEEVMKAVVDKTDAPFDQWLKVLGKMLRERKGTTFENIWKNSIETELQKSNLQRGDLEELMKMGKKLSQIELIELYIEQLEEEIQEKKEHYRTSGKLYKSMGVLGGIFLVILLL